jgi:hypothetical protein
LREGEPHGHPLVRLDVADPHGEDVRSFLLRDRGLLTARYRLAVLLTRLGALLEHALDDVVLRLHPHRGDGGPRREREDVGRLERHVIGVAEALCHPDGGDRAGDVGLDVDGVERQVALLGGQCAEAGLGLRIGSDVGVGERQDLHADPPRFASGRWRPRSANVSSSGLLAARIAARSSPVAVRRGASSTTVTPGASRIAVTRSAAGTGWTAYPTGGAGARGPGSAAC